jgi:hypothetical protein
VQKCTSNLDEALVTFTGSPGDIDLKLIKKEENVIKAIYWECSALKVEDSGKTSKL